MSYQEDDDKSLDLVQRWVISALVIVVGGSPTAALAGYSAYLGRANGDAVPLWVMSGVLGVAVTVAVLVIHRRRIISPLLLVGLVPAAISAYSLFRGSPG